MLSLPFVVAVLGVALAVLVVLAAGQALFVFAIGIALSFFLVPVVNRLERHMPRIVACILVVAICVVITITGLLIFAHHPHPAGREVPPGPAIDAGQHPGVLRVDGPAVVAHVGHHRDRGGHPERPSDGSWGASWWASSRGSWASSAPCSRSCCCRSSCSTCSRTSRRWPGTSTSGARAVAAGRGVRHPAFIATSPSTSRRSCWWARDHGCPVAIGMIVIGTIVGGSLASFALLLGLIAFAMELIPQIGPIISYIPALIIALTISPSPSCRERLRLHRVQHEVVLVPTFEGRMCHSAVPRCCCSSPSGSPRGHHRRHRGAARGIHRRDLFAHFFQKSQRESIVIDGAPVSPRRAVPVSMSGPAPA